jgi:FxsC-like protein
LEGGCVHASAAATAPYFFLSYAHKSRGDARDEGEADYWVSEFFRDLCRSFEQQAGLPKGARPGLMDRERRPGNEWPIEVRQALSTCRVFVPLYSSRYFADEYCGKEWYYFTHRALDPPAQEAAIVPVIWDPVELGKLPQAARAPLCAYRGSEPYETRGLYGIMKVSRYRAQYLKAVTDLASRMVEAAERHPVRPGASVDHTALETAFGVAEAARAAPEVRQVRITVVAPRRDELPDERANPRYYGRSPLDWRPYAPGCDRPIADIAAEVARSLGGRAEVGDLFDHREELLSGDTRSGPQILLIDPWTLFVPDTQQLLQRLKLACMPWVQAMIPWNPDDDETRQAEGKLRALLDATLRDKLAEAASTSEMAARGVPSLEHFDVVLRQLIAKAANKYLAHAAAYPPAGPLVERPRIS